jgi:glutaredoxin
VQTSLLVAALLLALAGPSHAQCGSRGVFVFSAHWCPACRATEQFLARNGIQHRRFEITDNREVQQFMRENFGTTSIPVIVIDGSYQLGYDVQWLQGALCMR